jgi:hypothetical protein
LIPDRLLNYLHILPDGIFEFRHIGFDLEAQFVIEIQD